MADDLQQNLERVKAGSREDGDIQAIVAAIDSGRLVLADAPGAVGVGGNVSSSQLITGNKNIAGDGNTVIYVYGADARTIQSVLAQNSGSGQAESITSIDELVQQIRSRLHDDIERLHGIMPLWGVDHWVPLGELFVDVNILEELSSSHRAELNDLWQDFTTGMEGYSSYRSLDRIGLGKERQRVSGLEVLTKNTNLIVVGKPGSGKTTYLQRVVTECNAGNLQAHRIPVLIRLREFVDDGRSFSYFLEQYLEQCWQLSEAETQLVLSQGRSLVLLDGLDEVTGEDGKSITKQIKRFARAYPQVQMVVTCRTQSFSGESDWKSLRFSFVEVADFNESQVRSFAEHWFKTVMQNEAAGLAKSQEFLKQLFREENKPIRELAITPILLSLTCAVFHQTGKFYSKRSKLYEEGLELLLEQWDKSREIERDEIYRDLSAERKLELLSYLAVKKFEQEQYVLFEQAEVEEYIAEFLGIGQREGRAVLKAIEFQHGLLIRRSQKVWSFSHLTFQEYFVAKWFCHRCNLWKELVCHIKEKQWQEAFLLTTELTKNSDKLLKLMKEEIDKNLQVNQRLDRTLEWIYHKVDGSKSIHKPVVKRVCYLLIILGEDLFHGFKLMNLLDPNCIRKYEEIYESFFENNERNGVYIENDFATYLECDLEYRLYSLFKGMIDLNYFLQDAPFHPKVDHGVFRTVIKGIIDNLDYTVSNYQFYEPLSNLLLELKQCFDNYAKDIISFRKWWTSESEVWLDKLKDMMVEAKIIDNAMLLDKRQEELLEKYYDTNNLLVHCLDIVSCNHPKLKSELMDMLLLPIAEIEKRKCEKSE